MSDPATIAAGVNAATNLGGSIASLFGSGNPNPSNVSQNPNSAINQANLPFTGSIITPSYAFSGGVLAPRTNAGATANAQLAQLFGNQLGSLNTFQQNLAGQGAAMIPGSGPLSRSMIEQATAAGQQAYGNLRDQLSQRNILGASFADNQLAQQQAQSQMNINDAAAKAFTAEMQAKLGLNQNQLDALAQQLANANGQTAMVNNQTQQALSELNLSTGFLARVKQTSDQASQAYQNNAVAQALGSTPTQAFTQANTSPSKSGMVDTSGTSTTSGVPAGYYVGAGGKIKPIKTARVK